MPDTTKLEIVTPEALVYSQDVDMVTLFCVEGQLGILLPHHIRLMTQLVPGEMTIRKGGRQEFMAVGEGFVEVTGSSVSVVTNMAIAADKIDEAAVEEARQRAAARLTEKISSEEVAAVNASLARSLVQLRVKRRHHRYRIIALRLSGLRLLKASFAVVLAVEHESLATAQNSGCSEEGTVISASVARAPPGVFAGRPICIVVDGLFVVGAI